ncbi:peptide deformylase, mitochondrial-like [Sinocyclocheilus anshuiensis]|uniref:peptide deformylase, mitochondrial-like n=1 Tax=Sinocyclocheilus anshuiensis TaxID=1608454 RepID=UPI0007B85840|nr:PREDICTED: peptide deformylase, mitochondrial-like [Sinocyclocheilus anshuiensis]XP_016318162.1 PREDICTED: peptide deformylase, mitochondrial-like [Sinocyclocheilus anshuiensis]
MFRHCRTFSHYVLKSQTNDVLSKPVRILLPWSPFTCTASPRTHSTNIKMRSYLQYMKRKVKGSPAPPYNHVCQVGDPVLHSRAAAVEPGAIQGPEVQKVIKTLVKVMRKLECVGLSAPQIGVPLQILALEYPKKMLEDNSIASFEARGLVAVPLMIFVNPQLCLLDGRTVIFQEACESICGYSASVPCYVSVEVSGLNEKAEPVSWQASGWLARILQHEIEYLPDPLYIDRMDIKTFINVKWEEYNE